MHAGRPERRPGAPVSTPVVLSSTFVAAPATDDGLAPDEPVNYARDGVATWEALESALGALEGGRAVAFGSGMAAVSAALEVALDEVGHPPGGPATVVTGRHGYAGTHALFDHLAGAGRLAVERVAVEDPAVLRATLARGAAVLWLESPVNPTMEVVDLAVAAELAGAAGALTVVDNTYATPLGQQPLDLGADLVVHSVTKLISGHSDVLLGAVVSRDGARGSAVHAHRTRTGAVPGPFEAFLALRGLRTLAVRLERAQRSALTLAQRLTDHPTVRRVRYPGLPTDPGHAVASRQLAGFGSVLAVDLATAATAEAVAGHTSLWLHATSLGGVESLLERRRRHPGEQASVPEGLLRLSVGIEDVDDLWDDLAAALSVADRLGAAE